MPREKILNKIKITDKIYVFRPCVGTQKYPGIVSSALEVLPKLGIEPVTSEDQTCCGGFLTFTNVAQPTHTMPVVARNLAISDDMDLDVCTFCNGCYSFLSEFSHFMNERPAVKEVVNTIISMIGKEYKGNHQIYHILEIMYKLKDLIAQGVVRPLKGIRCATHYGCHYLYAFKNTAIDDPFMPTVLEEMIELLGGEVVEYDENRSCCGTGLTQIIIRKEELSLPHTKVKLDSLKKAKPDLVVVVCPYCLSHLDRMQEKFNVRRAGHYDIPVIHLIQLIGLTLGLDIVKLGFDAHVIGYKDFWGKFKF